LSATPCRRCGRQVEALEQYERLRGALDEELGLQPNPDLQRLSAQIVRHDDALNPSTATSGPAVPPAVVTGCDAVVA